MCELSAGDRRAPGCEKKIVTTLDDYEQKRLVATKARQHKPMGEPRTPNPGWAGLGFSSSMPEVVMRKTEEEDKETRETRELAHNSDWFGPAVKALNSMFGGKDICSSGGDVEELPVILTNQGLSK